MDPKHLIQLSVILEKGSLSAASQHLLVAQPTLTRNMATLEMQAGAQLFRRSRFGVRSTPMGEVLAREGRALARSLQMAREQVSRYQLGVNQELRLGMGPVVSVAVGPALMNELHTRLPELSLTASVMRPQLAIDALVDSDLDMVIAPAPHQQQLPDVERHVLVDDRLGIFCGPDHPYTKRSDLSVDDFQNAEWVSIGMACVFDREHAKMLLDSGVTGIHTKMVFLGDAYCLCSTLMQSRHLVVMPAFLVEHLPPPFQLVELRAPGGIIAPRPLYLWVRESWSQSPAVTHIRRQFAELQGLTDAGGARVALSSPGQRASHVAAGKA